MRYFVIALLLSAAATTSAFAHGGGCRKAHLPQCCHMDNSTGTVHCH